MYERMLDKKNKPTDEEFSLYCGSSEEFYKDTNSYLLSDSRVERLLRFPYGKGYGWGYKYFVKSKHICDIFVEKDAFTIMLRLTNKDMDDESDSLGDSGKMWIKNKYPCGDGGWVNCRILNEEDLKDAKRLLDLKYKMLGLINKN